MGKKKFVFLINLKRFAPSPIIEGTLLITGKEQELFTGCRAMNYSSGRLCFISHNRSYFIISPNLPYKDLLIIWSWLEAIVGQRLN